MRCSRRYSFVRQSTLSPITYVLRAQTDQLELTGLCQVSVLIATTALLATHDFLLMISEWVRHSGILVHGSTPWLPGLLTVDLIRLMSAVRGTGSFM